MRDWRLLVRAVLPGLVCAFVLAADASACLFHADGIGMARIFSSGLAINGMPSHFSLTGMPHLFAVKADDPPVPAAHCGAGDVPESGLQGEAMPSDPNFLLGGFHCNLALVGQYAGNGANFQMAWYGNCAYMSTLYNPNDPDYATLKGTWVIDVSDPAHPAMTDRLTTTAMVSPHESLKGNDNGLLAADEGAPSPSPSTGASDMAGPWFDVYDVRSDCRHPKLLASVSLPNGSGHAGAFAPDGKTYYESTIENAPHPAIIAVDLSDPSHPHSFMQWKNPLDTADGFHDLSINADGKTGYFAAQAGNDNGLAIVDLTAVQNRVPGAVPSVIGHVSWHNSNFTQIPVYARIAGRPYLIAADEFGSQFAPESACQAGTDPFGSVHIVDIADASAPKVVSEVRLQVDDPANCNQVLTNNPSEGSTAYSAHYCAVDNPEDATAVACTWWGAGLRVFDVRDPKNPREIAYYNPPPKPQNLRGAMEKSNAVPDPLDDVTASNIRWVRTADGSTELWFQSMENGFQVVKFTNGTYPLPAGGGGGA